MEIFCEKCQKVVGRVADEKVPVGKKASVSCPRCREKIFFSRENPEPNPDYEDTILIPPGTDPRDLHKTQPAVEPPPSKPAPRANYDFAIMDVIRESWQKTNGAKGPVWGAGLLVMAIVIGLSIIIGVLMGLIGAGPGNAAFSGAMQLTISVALYPFLAGIMMIGIRRSVDLPISYKLAFNYFSYIVPIVISAILVSIMTTIGFILLFIPGLYLSIGYLLVIPLIVEKGMGPWEAMEASRKAIHKHWFKVFGLCIVMGLLYLLSMIPLGLGLIWTVPMFVVMGGILYRELFGVDEQN